MEEEKQRRKVGVGDSDLARYCILWSDFPSRLSASLDSRASGGRDAGRVDAHGSDRAPPPVFRKIRSSSRRAIEGVGRETEGADLRVECEFDGREQASGNRRIFRCRPRRAKNGPSRISRRTITRSKPRAAAAAPAASNPRSRKQSRPRHHAAPKSRAVRAPQIHTGARSVLRPRSRNNSRC